MELNCNEQILSDVCEVDIVLASECNLPIPPQVDSIVEMAEDSGIGTPALAIVAVNGVVAMDSMPTLEQTEKIQLVGKVVSHSLSIPVASGFEAVREAIGNIGTQDFNVVLHTDDGQSYLIYSLPCASSILLNEQDVNHTATVKVDIKSMNHVIRLS